MAMVATPALAAPRDQVDLPAGILGHAILALSVQTGVDIGIADPALANIATLAVRGRLSVEAALGRLLRGSGARAVAVAPGRWRIERSARVPAARSRQLPQPGPVSPTRADGDVIVTASKRAGRLDTIPASVQILAPALLSADDIPDADAIARGLAALGKTHLGTGRDKLFLRGIADSGFNGLTQSTVGEYFGDARISYGGPDPDLRLYDVARVEVLEGPQGTLYGAGALGGILRVVSNPLVLNAASGAVMVGASATAHGRPGVDANAVLNIPLVQDRVALRILGYRERNGGYIDDSLRGLQDVNRVDVAGGRAALTARVTDHLSVTLGSIVQRIDAADGQYADRTAPSLTRASSIAQGYRSQYVRGDFTIAGKVGATEINWSTAASRQKLFERFDGTQRDPPPVPQAIVADSLDTRVTLVSSELRVAHESMNGFGWVVGASLLHNEVSVGRVLSIDAVRTPLATAVNRTVEGTLYGEVRFPLIFGLRATLGGRAGFSRLDASLRQTVADGTGSVGVNGLGHRSERRALPSAALDWSPAAGTLVFLRYQQAYRPGGVFVSFGVPDFYGSDRLAALELGVRRRTPDLTVSLSLSHSAWRNIQADTAIGVGAPITSNIGNGTIDSIEATVNWHALRDVQFEANALLNRSRLTNDAIHISDTGTALPNVAVANVAGRISYERHLPNRYSATLSGQVRYVGPSTLAIGGDLGVREGDYVDTLARVGVARDHFAAAIVVTNLLDATDNRFALGDPYLLYRGQVTPQQPRTIRLSLSRAF